MVSWRRWISAFVTFDCAAAEPLTPRQSARITASPANLVSFMEGTSGRGGARSVPRQSTNGPFSKARIVGAARSKGHRPSEEALRTHRGLRMDRGLRTKNQGSISAPGHQPFDPADSREVVIDDR